MNDLETRRLLSRTAELAADFLEGLDHRPVAPRATLATLRQALGGPLQDAPEDVRAVVEQLAHDAEPGVVGMAGGRYFGFVIGGAVPAALAADWLASAWDQNAGLYVCGPAAAVAEEVVHGWLADLLSLPPGTSFAVTTGCQMAHVTCLAAARERILARAGWDVNERGLAGAPPIRVWRGLAATSPWTGLSASSASAAPRCGWCPRTARAACARTRSGRSSAPVRGRPSSARRRAR